MGANKSAIQVVNGEKRASDDEIEVLNTSTVDIIEKTADFIKSMENENYGRFKLMQYRISKR